MIVDGHVDVHGMNALAVFRGKHIDLSLAKIGIEEYSVSATGGILGSVRKTEDMLLPWKAYVGGDVVGERVSPAGAVGCVVQAVC